MISNARCTVTFFENPPGLPFFPADSALSFDIDVVACAVIFLSEHAETDQLIQTNGDLSLAAPRHDVGVLP